MESLLSSANPGMFGPPPALPIDGVRLGVEGLLALCCCCMDWCCCCCLDAESSGEVEGGVRPSEETEEVDGEPTAKEEDALDGDAFGAGFGMGVPAAFAFASFSFLSIAACTRLAFSACQTRRRGVRVW